LAVELWIVKFTGPPTAVRTNVPLAGLPVTALSRSCTGTARKVPGVGGGDGDGEGEGDEEGDGEGEGDRDAEGDGEGDREAPGDEL
jgi:hypothetical protein